MYKLLSLKKMIKFAFLLAAPTPGIVLTLIILCFHIVNSIDTVLLKMNSEHAKLIIQL